MKNAEVREIARQINAQTGKLIDYVLLNYDGPGQAVISLVMAAHAIVSQHPNLHTLDDYVSFVNDAASRQRQ